MLHAFDDIERKGAARGFITNINEKMHGPFKDIFKFKTNFKEFVDQVRSLYIGQDPHSL